MKKAVQNIFYTICMLVLLAGMFGGGYYFRDQQIEAENTEIVEDTAPDIQLPGEVEKRIVTKEEVEGKLVEIKELSTYSSEYTVEKAADFSRYALDDKKIPGTTNSIDLTGSGVVKVGYDVDAIEIKVDNDSRKIYISLPEAKLNDNYIIWDTVTCVESNNILNPIDFDQYKSLITDMEALGLQQAEENGIYSAAEDNIKMLIENFLSGFDDFEIVFM